jgi:hypothetical protein
MEGFNALPAAAAHSHRPAFSYRSAQASYRQVVIEKTLLANNSDAVSIDSSLSVGGQPIDLQDILKKINDRLKQALPNGVESLKQEDTTSEATSDRIVKGITALYDAYRKSNPELDDEEALTRFMKAARSGVDQGYGEAADFLEGAGAFQVDGVKDGIEKTKSLIEEKLKAFETKKLSDFQSNHVGTIVSNEIVSQAGAGVAVVA